MARLQKDGTSHENLIQMIFCCWDRELLMLIEFCELGTLDDALSMSATAYDRGEALWFRMACGVARGMEYMHSREPMIIHRDLKPDNVLVQGRKSSPSNEWIAKIADFGESREYKEGDNLSMVGTPFFCCPEIVLCEEYNEKADVYSFGVLLFHMVTFSIGGIGAARWGGKRFSRLNVVKGRRPEIPNDLEPWLLAIILSCWSGRSYDRPSFKTIYGKLDENRNSPCVKKAQVNKLQERVATFERDASTKPKDAGDEHYNSRVENATKESQGEDYVRITTLSEDVFQEACDVNDNIGLSKRMERVILLAKMLGYSLILSLFNIFAVAAWSNVSNLRTDRLATKDDGVVAQFPVYDAAGDGIHFLVPLMILYSLLTVGNIGRKNNALYPDGGPKYALVPLFLSVFLPPVFYSIIISLPPTLDLRYNFLTYFFAVVYMVAFITLDIFFRRKWSNMNSQASTVKTNASGTKGAKSKGMQRVQSDGKDSTLLATIVSLTVTLLTTVFVLAYIIYILPIYFNADTGTRMIICLVVHPISVECNEILNRIGQIYRVKEKDIDIAKEKVLSEAHPSIVSKIFPIVLPPIYDFKSWRCFVDDDHHRLYFNGGSCHARLSNRD